MIKYQPSAQLGIDEFKTPFQSCLLEDNRWVKLSKIVPWDRFASLYIRKMNINSGRPAISPRIVLGAMIIKHIEKLDDRGTIASIQENPYMQFFVGLTEFTVQPVFDPSLFVEIRKRIGHADFDNLNVDLIKSVSSKSDQRHNNKNKGNGAAPPNKGKLQADATVADQYITHPTDTGILNTSRKQCEKLIDILYGLDNKTGIKPRTYRRKMNQVYLNFSKKKKKSNALIRKTVRKLLECLKRDINHIHHFLDKFESNSGLFPLTHQQQRMFWIINTVYQQQKQMYDDKTHSCQDRIVSIFQPHVRPVPRGKAKSNVEFGSKLGVSLDNGFSRIDTLSWDAYNEGGDLVKQVENYKQIHGYYPDLVLVDKIYATNANRKWLKARGIRITAPALGRPKTREPETYYQKRKRRKEAAQRNQVEGKFGQGKNGYDLNKIRARLQSTSESWVACIFFVMNLIHLNKMVSFYCFLSIKRRLYAHISKLTIEIMAIIHNSNYYGAEIQEIEYC